MRVRWVVEEPVSDVSDITYTKAVRDVEVLSVCFPGVEDGTTLLTGSHPPAWESTLENILSDEALDYETYDIVELQGPQSPDMLRKFFREHKHESDEIRFIVEGYCFFDVRPVGNATNGWYRVDCEPGDIVTIPAGRYHRFGYNPQSGALKAVRIFKEDHSWSAAYRYPGLFDSD
jgi:cupin superfamily acireductone dioxygenase involved in methionine salvage